ncbi:MAG: hypothetical protein GY711_16890 [bacterium]|nr:hypothetical protein [bacterium]
MNTLVLALALAAAPDPDTFEITHGGPAADRGVHVTATRDGGYAAIGITQSSGAGGDDVYLVRTDASGKVLWSTTYGGEADELGWYVHEAADGFILAGSTKSSGSGGHDFYLVKTDERGEHVWSRTYGGAKDDRCWALAPTEDGGFVLVGETASSGAGERDGFLVKTDAEGKELWTRTFGGERDDRFFAVTRIGDGYILAGQTFSEGAGDRDAYVVRTDANGEPQWSKTFGGPASDVAHAVCTTKDGAAFVTGYTTSLATEGDDPYLILIGADGTVRWERVVPLPGVAHTITGQQGADGGFYCVGFSTVPSSRRMRALLLKTDARGFLEWRRSYFESPLGESMAYSVRATKDGGCVFAGHTTSAAGDADLALVKVAGPQQ